MHALCQGLPSPPPPLHSPCTCPCTTITSFKCRWTLLQRAGLLTCSTSCKPKSQKSVSPAIIGQTMGWLACKTPVPQCPHHPRLSLGCCAWAVTVRSPSSEEHLQKVHWCLTAADPKKMQHRSKSHEASMGHDGSCWRGYSIP